jgi:hypothetical protein
VPRNIRLVDMHHRIYVYSRMPTVQCLALGRQVKFETKENFMERLVAFGAIAYLALGLLSEAHAERIVHPTGGFSLDFPKGWVIEKKKSTYSLTHSDGSSFEGTLAQLPPNASLKVAARMARAAALATGLCSKEPASEFELAGPGWKGNGFHCNGQIDGKSRPTQTIGFIVKINSGFYQFFLFVPLQDWATNREQYLALFKSLRIGA